MVRANSSLKGGISPDHLPGERHERVFVGGHYDFMPTLRLIDQFIRQISCPEKRLVPIIPLDYDIEVEQTIDWDIEILDRCRYAIFPFYWGGGYSVEFLTTEERELLNKLYTDLPKFRQDEKILGDALCNPNIEILLTTDEEHLVNAKFRRRLIEMGLDDRLKIFTPIEFINYLGQKV